MLKLNPDPTFEADVEITVPGQEETGTVPLTFKYRSKKQYFEWLETLKEKREPDKLDKDGKVVKEGKLIKKGKSFDEVFHDFVLGWGLSEAFNGENVAIFLDNYPMAYVEIVGFYSQSLLGSRIKN